MGVPPHQTPHDIFSRFVYHAHYEHSTDPRRYFPRKYSPKMRCAYTNYNKALCRFSRKPPEGITPDDVQKHLAHLEKERNLSASSMNLAISSFKFFYGAVMKRAMPRKQYRPKQDQKVPIVLSRTEVKGLLDAKTNPKHRILLMLVYSAGLRVVEAVRLKKEHIDLSRKTIIVFGKGRKERHLAFGQRMPPHQGLLRGIRHRDMGIPQCKGKRHGHTLYPRTPWPRFNPHHRTLHSYRPQRRFEDKKPPGQPHGRGRLRAFRIGCLAPEF